MAEQAWEAINTALSIASGPEKIQHLTAAKEWVIHRKQEIPASELLELISELCSPALQLDSFQGVRHFVLQFIEELCRTQGATAQLLLKPLEALALMLEDVNQPDQIARWALTTAAKSWKCAMALLATQTKHADASRSLKSLLWRIKATAIDTVERRKDKSARINAVKCLEVMSMSMLNELPSTSSSVRKKREAATFSSSAPTAPQFESLKDLPRFAHPALPKAADLNREGMQLLEILSTVMKNADTPSQVRTACSNSLILVARVRPDARDMVVDALVAVTHSSIATKDIAFAQALKTNAIMLLKSIVPDEKSLDNPNLVKVTQVLRTLKADEHISRHLDPLKKRKLAQDAEAEEIKRRLKDYPSQQNRFPTEGLHLLPIETLSRLLVDNAGNVPEKPPPGHHYRPPRDSQVLLGPTGLPPRVERLMALIRAVETGRGGILPKPLQELKALELSQQDALKQRGSAFSRVCQASLESSQFGRRSRGFGWAEKAHETFGMVAARLACDYDPTSVHEEDDEHNNMGELRDQLISELLVKAGASGVPGSLVSGAASEEEVAVLAALNLEFVAEKCGSNGNSATATQPRYEPFVNKLVTGLVADVGKNYRRLGKILSDAPMLPNSTLAILLNVCENLQNSKQLFSVIREVSLARPTSRKVLLQVLLMYATTPDPLIPSTAPKAAPGAVMALKDRRLDAVRLIANKLFKGLGQKWMEEIKLYANAVFKSLSLSLQEVAERASEARALASDFIQLQPAKERDGTIIGGLTVDEEKGEIVARIHLMVALCASEVQLLPELFSGYAFVRARVLKEATEVPTGINELRIKQRTARIFDLIHMETDQLWAKLASETNNSGKLIALLQDFAPGAEELVLRACQVFAKKDPDGALIPVSSLRAMGSPAPMIEIDPRFIVPVIGSLGKEEAMQGLTQLAQMVVVQFPGEPAKAKEEVKRALDNIVNGTVGRTIDASELLVRLANMDTKEDQALVLATDAFMEMKSLINDRVMRRVFQELVEQEQYPVVLLRILIMAYRSVPSLKLDALEVLQRLVEREIWHNENLWKGFVILAGKLLPESLEMILRLPDDVFKSFITETEKTNKNFRDLLRNAAQLNASVVESLQRGEEGMEVEGKGEQGDSKSETKRELSAFAREYLGL